MDKKTALLPFLAVAIAAALAGAYFLNQQNDGAGAYEDERPSGGAPQTTTDQKAPETAATTDPSVGQGCTSPVRFTHQFTDIGTIDSIVPPVFRNSKGIMPTTLINIGGKAPLYMPADGRLTQGSYHTEQGAEFYMWEADVGCGVTIVFDHVTEPVEKVRKLFPSEPRDDTRTDPFNVTLEVEAGELVGHTTGSVGARNWNFAAYDASERNYLWGTGEFGGRPKYFTQVCPFRYYDEQTRREYEALFVASFNEITVEENLCR